ncbi:MAG: alpha/beta hydrolase [Deltaproteobacteria bacterium]|nr:alpha/beta hydrolase [Deltaproteobacteria bacterium]
MVTTREDMVTANGLQHHVVVWGDHPVDVVLCHGFLDIAWSFDGVARELVQAGHGVASFDWRGHGQTDWIGAGGYYHFPDYVLDLEGLLPQLSRHRIHLVGHSMGGSACVMYAAARPEKLRTLSLIEGIGPPEMEPRDPAAHLRAWLDGVAKVRGKTHAPMKDEAAALRRMRFQNPELPDELGLFLASKSTTAVEGGLQWTFDPLHKTFSPRPFQADLFSRLLEAIPVPTLVIAGEQGLRLDDEQARMSRIRDHRFVELADVGHMIHWFEPQRLSSELAAFFAEHGP